MANWKQRKRTGYNCDLYRDSEKGVAFGVCAGIARTLDIEPNLVRLFFIIGFFMMGGFTVFAYIVGIIALAKVPKASFEEQVQQRSRSKSAVLREAQSKLDALNDKVAGMESFVTSRQYRLKQAFKEIE